MRQAGAPAAGDCLASAALQVLKESDVSVLAPPLCGTELLRRVHTPSYLSSLELAHERPARLRSASPPQAGAVGREARPHDWLAAQCAAYSAAAAARHVSGICSNEIMAFALSYPDGRHVHSDKAYAAGYVNNSAIAAAAFLETYDKVVVLSLGTCHADGVQEIFYHRSDVMTISLHARSSGGADRYTGAAVERGHVAGYGYNLNFPLPDPLTGNELLRSIDNALDVLHDYRPQAMVFALNFHGPGTDACCMLPLDAGLGRCVGERVAALSLPTAVVLEVGGEQPCARPVMTDFLRGLVPAVAHVRHR